MCHPEGLVDKFYCYDELLISHHPEQPMTQVMRTWLDVRERITAAKVALADEDMGTYNRCVRALDRILITQDYANYLEFTSFFPVMDVSFSMYRGLSEGERVPFLDALLRAFIEKRQAIYDAHGYSASTLQVRKDFEKHKSQGNFANVKIRHILRGFDYQEASVESGPNTFCFIDDTAGKRSLDLLCQDGATWYEEWSETHQGKQADVIFRSGNDYYICEAKHVKEGGGGQDKQIAEIIAFVSNQDHIHGREDVYYVSFLDGVYFNKFVSPRPRTKIHSQKAQIEAALEAGGPNYFINTHGLDRLLRSI